MFGKDGAADTFGLNIHKLHSPEENRTQVSRIQEIAGNGCAIGRQFVEHPCAAQSPLPAKAKLDMNARASCRLGGSVGICASIPGGVAVCCIPCSPHNPDGCPNTLMLLAHMTRRPIMQPGILLLIIRQKIEGYVDAMDGNP